MIVSKPKIKAVFALSVFTVLVFIALIMLMRYIIGGQVFSWWLIILASVVAALAFGLTFKSLNDFKTLKLFNNKLSVISYLGLVKQEYQMESLKAWTEDKVKTNREPFLEITMVFSNKKFVKINNQQDAGFKDFTKYLNKKKSKLRIELNKK